MRTAETMRDLPQLDGIRGLAALIVIFGHVLVFKFGFGISRLGAIPPIGVNLLFVMSGYLSSNRLTGRLLLYLRTIGVTEKVVVHCRAKLLKAVQGDLTDLDAVVTTVGRPGLPRRSSLFDKIQSKEGMQALSCQS